MRINQFIQMSLCWLLWCGIGLQQAWAILPISHWTTTTGAKVYFVANPGLPMLDVAVDFPAGSVYDQASKAGVAGLTQGLLRLGADGLSEDQIAQQFADVGAQLGGRIDDDRAGLSLRMLSEPRLRTVALTLMSRLLRAPDYPELVVAREKARLIDALKESALKPDTQVGKLFSQLVYGSHPYAIQSDAASVARITRADLRAFHQQHFVAERAIVAIMGDVTRAEAERIAEQLTQGLPRATAPALTLPVVERLNRGVTRIVAHPALQSHILIGGPGIARADPDYFSLFVGNHILGGGGFVSRITEAVRQQRGLAYSAYSYFAPQRWGGMFVIGMQTRRDQANEALSVTRQVLAEYVAQGPTAAELEAAKQNIVGGFPLRIDSNRKIIEYLSAIGFYQLPLTYLDDFVMRVEQVSAADIRAAFARRVDPAKMVTVVVGADRDETQTESKP